MERDAKVWDGWDGTLRTSRWPDLDSVNAFRTEVLLIDVLLAAFIVFSVGFSLDRSLKKHGNPFQFRLSTMLLLMVCVAVLFAAVQADSTYWKSASNFVAWLLLGFLVYGVTCGVSLVWTGIVYLWKAGGLRSRYPAAENTKP